MRCWLMYPRISSTAKVPITLTGTATAGISVAVRLPRNRNTTMTTSTKAIPSVIRTSCTVALTKVVVS